MWGAIVALVASAALQQINSNLAASRQNRATQAALKRQRDYQRQTEKTVMETAQEYEQQNRADRQENIARELTQRYYEPVEAAQTAHAAETRVQGDVSQDYQQAKTAADNRSLATARELAGLYGRQNSAYRLRQNEAITMADRANQVARINDFARGQSTVDQYAINAAGRGNPFLQLGSQLLGMYGTSALGGALSSSLGSSGVAGLGGAAAGQSAGPSAGSIMTGNSMKFYYA